MKCACLLYMLLLAAMPGGMGLVICEGDEQHSQGEGAGDGWNYTGRVGGGGGIYLGHYEGGYWVMTNQHVHANDFHINGSTYSYIAGSAVQVGSADLILYRIDVQPDDTHLGLLPNLKLMDSVPNGFAASGEDVVMIGFGAMAYDRDITMWKVDRFARPDVWTTDMNAPGVIEAGYLYQGGSSVDTKRWAVNTAIFGETQDKLMMTFDDIAGEGQAVAGDSGGGLFYFNAATGSWELAGILTFVSVYESQPGNAVVFGNRTYALNMLYYSDDIMRILGKPIPEPSSALLLLLGCGVCSWPRKRRLG